MALAEYQKKRRFNETPEPKGKASKRGRQLHFVVQKHAASRLHYDLRLEMDGVMKSWAVPKGPSLNPDDKRLAMHVEDHPMEYNQFEGVIPEGNYGAGTVMIWDSGTVADYEGSPVGEAEKSLLAGYHKGDLKFELHGQKLKGWFVLVKTGYGKDTWLLIKKDDQHASKKDVTKLDKSTASGKTMDQIASSDKKWTSSGGSEIDLTDAPQAKQPDKLQPMLCTLVKRPFDDPDWLFEVKWDGYRIVAHIKRGQVKLLSRNNRDYTPVFGPVAEELQKLNQNYILDGEMVVVDKSGKSDFGALQNYQKTGQGNLIYYVFDVPFAGGHDLRSLPLARRKLALKALVKGLSRVKYSDHIEKDGKAFFDLAQKQGLEGIVAKKADSAYQEGKRGANWLKIKTHLRQEAVIGGWTEPKGSRKNIGALILGVYRDGKLQYIGHTGGGLDEVELDQLHQQLKKLEQKASPFSAKFKTNAPAHWVKPQLVCEVNFAEWTSDGQMRQPIFVGMRNDKDPQDVKRELAK